MKTLLVLTAASLAIVGCGSGEKPPTKEDFAPRPKPAGWGPPGGPAQSPPANAGG